MLPQPRGGGGRRNGGSFQALAASGDGTYEVDLQAVFDAESSVIKARNEVVEQERDVQSAEAKFTEAKQGKLKKTSGKGGAAGLFGGESLGQSIVGGIFETLGVPNSMNLFETPKREITDGAGQLGPRVPRRGESDTSDAAGGGGPLGGAMSGIGLPNLATVLKPMGPQALKPTDPNTTAHGQGAGAVPGGFDVRDAYQVIVNGNVGMDPRAFTDRVWAASNAAWRGRMSSTRPG